MNTAEPINQDTCIMMELTWEIDNMVNFRWPQNVHITRFHCILHLYYIILSFIYIIFHCIFDWFVTCRNKPIKCKL